MFGDIRLPRRFWNKVQTDDVSGCWRWTAGHDRNGYPRFWPSDQDNYVHAHRAAYTALIEKPIDGWCVARTCQQRSCVNPEHMEVVR